MGNRKATKKKKNIEGKERYDGMWEDGKKLNYAGAQRLGRLKGFKMYSKRSGVRLSATDPMGLGVVTIQGRVIGGDALVWKQIRPNEKSGTKNLQNNPAKEEKNHSQTN